MLINLLHHAKFLRHAKSATCVISIIIDLPAVVFVTQLPYPVSVLWLTSGCKSAPAQYKGGYYLAPPQSLLRKQIKTKLMLCKPLFIVHGRIKGFTTVQKQSTSVEKLGMAHALQDCSFKH